MAIKFNKLTRPNIRKLKLRQSLREHGITFERLQNNDGCYRVNVMVDGQRIHRTIGKESDGVTRFQAEEFISKVKTDARRGRLNLPKGRKLEFGFKEAAKKYLSKLQDEGGKDLKMKNMRLAHNLIPFFKDRPLSKISSFDIERFKKFRLETGVTNSTVNRDLAVLSHIYTKSLEWKWLDNKSVIIKKLKENQGRIIYLIPEQISRLLKASKEDQNPQISCFIMIGLETGMRRMEILSIRLEHIDLLRRIIYIPRGKSGSREQPMTKSLAKFLREKLGTKKNSQGWLFTAKSKSGHTVSIEKAFRRVVLRAGLDPTQVNRHTLRHTAITHLVQAGVDLPTVKRISGHKTLAMVERYSHQNGEHIQAAMDKLAERIYSKK